MNTCKNIRLTCLDIRKNIRWIFESDPFTPLVDSVTPGPVILLYMDVVFMEVNVDDYHPTRVNGFFFHHFEPL